MRSFMERLMFSIDTRMANGYAGRKTSGIRIRSLSRSEKPDAGSFHSLLHASGFQTNFLPAVRWACPIPSFLLQ